MFGLFVNTLTGDTRILFVKQTIYSNMLRCNYLKKMFFTIFFLSFEIRFNFKRCQEKVTLIAGLFLNLQTPKNVVR